MKRTVSDTAKVEHLLSRKESLVRGIKLLGLQFGVLIILTALFAVFDLDRTIASYFYHPGDKWFLGHHPLWRVLYEYGTLPGILLALICLAGWLISFFNLRLEAWRPYFLLVVLTTVIACGLLVNTVFKQYWGRPRPNQISELGGYYPYRHVFPPGIPGKGASFPSGHSAMGFSVITLVFLRRRSKKIAYAGLATGLVLGGLLSAARMVKGAHFPTDMIWSLGFVTMTATALYYCIQKIPARQSAVPGPAMKTGKKIGIIIIVSLVAVLMTLAFMTRRPFYKTLEFQAPLGPEINRIVIRMDADPEQLAILPENTDKATLLVHARGFGWAWVDYEIRPDIEARSDTLIFTLDIEARSYFAELDHSLEVTLPAARKDHIAVDILPLKDSP
jgi:membrane-associated PAP2 superfamily phosphatase